MGALPRWLHRSLPILGAVNALDITTSLIPTPGDHLVPMPGRSAVAWVVQLALLVPFGIWLARRVPSAVRGYRALPIPPVPCAVLTTFLLISLVHVSLRRERYPWSPIAMFSSAVPHTQAESISRMGYVVVRGDELEAVSFLREGSPWFGRHDLGFDYKAGWTMHLYAPTHSTARDVLFARVRDEGLPEPLRMQVTYSRATGRPQLTVHRVAR